jgi:hypothetical protein
MFIARIFLFFSEVFACFLLGLTGRKGELMYVAEDEPGQAIKLAGTRGQISSQSVWVLQQLMYFRDSI